MFLVLKRNISYRTLLSGDNDGAVLCVFPTRFFLVPDTCMKHLYFQYSGSYFDIFLQLYVLCSYITDLSLYPNVFFMWWLDTSN